MSGSLILFACFLTLILIPCLGAGILGYHMIEKVGRYPSKTPAIQVDVFLKLITIEFFSIVSLLVFYWVFVG